MQASRLLIEYAFDDEARTRLRLVVNLADILADDAQEQRLHAAHEAHDACQACPAGHGLAHERRDHRPDDADERQHHDEQARKEHHADGLDGQAGDAVKGQGQHLFQGILALSRRTGKAVIAHLFHGHIQTGYESPQEQILREKLVEYGKKLVKKGLVQGTWGNISIRLDSKYMLVTPSGLDYMRLTPDDMVKVEINSLKYEGNLKPTSEKGLHASIYKNRADIGAVVHTHSKYCSVFAAAKQAMPVNDESLQEIFGAEVPLAEYGLPGSGKLADNTAKALGDNMGCIMSHHGMVACGEDIEEAFDNCAKLEEYAGKYLGK